MSRESGSDPALWFFNKVAGKTSELFSAREECGSRVWHAGVFRCIHFPSGLYKQLPQVTCGGRSRLWHSPWGCMSCRLGMWKTLQDHAVPDSLLEVGRARVLASSLTGHVTWVFLGFVSSMWTMGSNCCHLSYITGLLWGRRVKGNHIYERPFIIYEMLTNTRNY
jgi:hypothetical protein